MRGGQGRRAAAGTLMLIGLAAAAWLGQSGCEPYGVVAAAGADTVFTALPQHLGDGQADLFFYRITSRKSGDRLGVARQFHLEEERQVRSVVQLRGVEPGRELLVHVLWLNPDGKEVFTKEVHVRPEDWADEALRAELAKSLVVIDPEQRLVELESRYGVEPDRIDEELHKPEENRRFKLGTWTVRAYLFRKLILESSFELLPME